jgi:hypothetical protein
MRQKVMKLLKEIEARGNAMKVLAIANSLVMLLGIGMLAVGGKLGHLCGFALMLAAALVLIGLTLHDKGELWTVKSDEFQNSGQAAKEICGSDVEHGLEAESKATGDEGN